MEAKDREGNTPLLLAARGCRSEIVSVLLKHGAALEVVDREGNTPLLLATREHCAERPREGKPSLFLTSRDHGVNHPRDYSLTVSVLLEWGAKVDSINNHHSNSLLMATKAGYVELVD